MTSLFSAPEEQPRRSALSSPPPMTDPFHAPDFEEDGSCRYDDEDGDEDAPESASGVREGPGPSPALR
ncbi:hypothetical protein [Streptomyces sp. NBC_00448]|uniref:hypothetical protein n=1 Tax=Streptomyces sp. NBC_00448 TaxID=2903652 RepID=UPI002E1F87C9